MIAAARLPRFLGTVETTAPAAVVLGAPLDATESFRSGTKEAPTRVRLVSEVLETYSPEVGRDLAELPLADWGDVPCRAGEVEEPLGLLADACEGAARHGLPLVIGGEHTATLGAIRGVRRLYPDLFVIQLDAHLDLRDTYGGLRLSHATVMRRVAEEIGFDRLAQFGVRSGTREEYALARRCLESSATLKAPPRVLQRIRAHPLYLTIDIDVLDPACAPGTGCPEPGGATFRDVTSFLHVLRGMNVVGADVMEVLPAVDVNDISSIAAAKLIREIALLFARSSG